MSSVGIRRYVVVVVIIIVIVVVIILYVYSSPCHTTKHGPRGPKYVRERGVYPTQDTSRMGTARVKQEEEADTRIIVKE